MFNNVYCRPQEVPLQRQIPRQALKLVHCHLATFNYHQESIFKLFQLQMWVSSIPFDVHKNCSRHAWYIRTVAVFGP